MVGLQMKSYRITIRAAAIAMLLLGFICAAMGTGISTLFTIGTLAFALYLLNETRRKEYHQ